MVAWDGEALPGPDDLGDPNELGVSEAFDALDSGVPAGSAEAARQAGDDAVAGLDKVTAQLSGGEHRPEQQEMCRAVSEALVMRTHLVVQAGTGTGKSLAYLVPAALSGRKVVVATATKALQDQLAGKDLPLVDAALGLPAPIEFAVLKGRSNYICRQRVAEVGSGGIQAELGDPGSQGPDESPGPDELDVTSGPNGRKTGDEAGAEAGGLPPEGMVEEVRRLVAWSQTTDSGDRADLSFEPSDRAWGMLSVGPRECPGAFNCPSGGRCFAESARDRAAAADIVVVNTHLYGAHLASGGAVLPEHNVVVFDEAHELEEVMTASLGVDIAPGRFRALATAARPLVEPKEAEVLDALAALGEQLGLVLRDLVGTRVLHDGTPEAGGSELAALLDRAAELSRRAVDSLRRGGAQRSFLGDDTGADPDRASRKTRAMQAAAHLAEDLHWLANRTEDEVAWVDGTRRSARLRLSPVDVGPTLAAMLWGEVTTVLTSATIPPRLVDRVGLERFPNEVLDVGSPFDYRSHALLYVARQLPDRRARGAEEAMVEELARLIGAAGGRTLALFTSRRATEAAAEALADELPYELLRQGDLPKARLLERFADDETSCLFATLGFWQGVDVPGRALSLVTIDRLPFPRPDDPLLQARRDRAGGSAFSVVDLPRAATLLAQGAGRLIRTAEDRGVVAVLDPRLATASYRGVLLTTLPPMRRSVDFTEVASFLRRALGGEAA